MDTDAGRLGDGLPDAVLRQVVARIFNGSQREGVVRSAAAHITLLYCYARINGLLMVGGKLVVDELLEPIFGADCRGHLATRNDVQNAVAAHWSGPREAVASARG